MKLSIILTVYNKEPYLRKALDALISYKGVYSEEYEILAVNDGSTDGSSIILEEYICRDSRIKVLTQTNQGLSMARNNGIDASTGDYVWFVDADDVISDNAVEILCRAMETKPDVIPIYAITEGDNRIRNKISTSVKTGKDVLIERKWEDCGVFFILKRNFLNDKCLRFVPGMFHEDAEFTPRMLYEAQLVVVVPQVLYTVVRTPGSITNVPNPKRAYDLLSVAEGNYELVENNDLWNSKVGHSICYHGAFSITNALHIVVQQNKEEINRFNNCFYKERHFVKMFFYSLELRYLLFGLLLLLFPKKSVFIYRILK